MPSAVETWNRKLHIYLGLFFLFFLWLFCLSGVVLNHHWRFASFWDERKQTSVELHVVRPAETDELQAARNVMAQIDIRGEVSGKIERAEADRLEFRVVRPGDMYDIKADFAKGLVSVGHIHVNGWGILNMLHSFTGVRRTDPTLHQNWWATGIWRFSMDALSVALVIMVLSGTYMWYSRARQRRNALIALALGFITLAALVGGIF